MEWVLGRKNVNALTANTQDIFVRTGIPGIQQLTMSMSSLNVLLIN